MTVACYLNNIRDLEAGFLPARAGRREAHATLLSPFGLAFRLQRVGIISWIVGIYILGASYGSVFGDLESFFQDNEILQELLIHAEGFTLVEQFIPMLLTVIALASSIPALMIILKVKSEENKGRIEPILGAEIGRSRLLGGYLSMYIIVVIVVLALAAIVILSVGIIVLERSEERRGG